MSTDDTTVVAAQPQQKSAEKQQTAQKRKPAPRYNVLLWDDDQHSYEYVVEMMQKLFGYSTGKGLRIAYEVDQQGVAVCLTTTLEHAELKCQQIINFGRDHLIATCVASMKSTIERVE